MDLKVKSRSRWLYVSQDREREVNVVSSCVIKDTRSSSCVWNQWLCKSKFIKERKSTWGINKTDLNFERTDRNKQAVKTEVFLVFHSPHVARWCAAVWASARREGELVASRWPCPSHRWLTRDSAAPSSTRAAPEENSTCPFYSLRKPSKPFLKLCLKKR